jgi:HEAT repeat protein
LVNAFIDDLTHPSRLGFEKSTNLIPLPRAVLKILYTLCKVRGPRIISSFFNVEPQYLQPMVTAFLKWDQSDISDGPVKRPISFEWNERYVMLLWISQLLLAPFDLSSLSAPADLDNEPLPFQIQAEGMPQVAKEVLQICHKYLGVGSKEREAASALLVRLLLRPDMRNLHLLEDVVRDMINTFGDRADSKALYVYVGYLSFLSKLFSLADAETVAAMIVPTSSATLKIATGYGAIDLKVQGSALARKIIIKVLRGCVILLLEHSAVMSRQITEETNTNINNEVVDHLLTSLGDQDTPVRYAASKALAMIALKLGPEMSLELVNVIIESLEEDISRIKTDSDQRDNDTDHKHLLGSTTRDFAAVDQFRWHGTTLTLSQLLFRRSPQPELLPRILDCLIVALSFEQKSSTGGSLGTSVRDVACFGVWSISRKYTTAELLAIDRGLATAERYKASFSTIQILAAELTVTATLDPAGNIRRGSSAALQELVGRHPDTVNQGIPLIQIVDYHAVARRTIAMTDVALGAAKLDEIYASAILHGLMGWRGLQSSDLESRRAAAKSVGILSGLLGPTHQSRAMGIIQDMTHEILHLQERNVDERHGYMLAIASVLDVSSTSLELSEICETSVLPIFKCINQRMLTAFEVRPEVTAEACCVLLASNAHAIHSSNNPLREYKAVTGRSLQLLNICVLQNSTDVVHASSKAAYELSKILDSPTRSHMITEWTSSTTSHSKGAIREPMVGIIEAIGATFTSLSGLPGGLNNAERTKDQESILDALIAVTKSPQIEARVAGLHAISHVLKSTSTISAETITCIRDGLNDYTVDERGDIGSHVRIAALEATHLTFTRTLLPIISPTVATPVPPLYPEILRLAGEKLDKIRSIASRYLISILPVSTRPTTPTKNVSSVAFFLTLLNLPYTLSQPSLALPILTGLLTSAASGSQTVSAASLTALLSHLSSLSQLDKTNTLSTFLTILRSSSQKLNERLAQPTLTTVSFLLDGAAFGHPADFPWRALYVATAKAHLKSKSSPRVEAAVGVYVALYRSVPDDQLATRREVLAKLASMLVHPLRQVRLAVVEGLWELGVERGAGDELIDVLEKEDWGGDVKGFKEKAKHVQLEVESWS